jgi:hypothetical protein
MRYKTQLFEIQHKPGGGEGGLGSREAGTEAPLAPSPPALTGALESHHKLQRVLECTHFLTLHGYKMASRGRKCLSERGMSCSHFVDKT